MRKFKRVKRKEIVFSLDEWSVSSIRLRKSNSTPPNIFGEWR